MLKCKSCGAALDLKMATCPACGDEVQMGRLTGLLGIVCRNCDAYNDPGAKSCASCGQPIGTRSASAPAAQPDASSSAAAATPTPGTAAVPGSSAVPIAPPASDPTVPVVPGVPPRGPGAPAALPRPGAQPAGTPIRLVTVCPSCGGEAGAGQFCARCGHPLGGRGTLIAARPSAAGQRATPDAFGALQPGRAKLVLERGEGFDGAIYRLNAPEVAAGRSRGAILFPSDASLAAHHATFLYRSGALHIRDEGAPGGVFLKLRGLSVPLKPGDLFVVGDRLLRFAGPPPPPAAPPPDGTKRFGSPRPAGVAILVEEWLEGGIGGRVYLRPGPSITLGRAGCSINLGDDPYLSQAHAEIAIEPDGSAKLRDLGSSNGTFVRVPARTERELRDGDVVRMGREVLRVVVA